MFFLQSFEFNLGLGVKTTSPQEAGELLMKREYPQILESATTPHAVIFIPEVYLYGNATERVTYLCLLFYYLCYDGRTLLRDYSQHLISLLL